MLLGDLKAHCQFNTSTKVNAQGKFASVKLLSPEIEFEHWVIDRYWQLYETLSREGSVGSWSISSGAKQPGAWIWNFSTFRLHGSECGT